MSIRVQIDDACGNGEPVPAPALLRRWLRAALHHLGRRDAQVAIRIVGEAEGAEIYARYRLRRPRRATRPHATNVLSFPADLPDWVDLPQLGDLVICAPVVNREAAEQGKAADAHWAHMVVHGTLHLLGHDHRNDADAERMEALETEILAGLRLPPPYVAPVPASAPA